MKDPLIWLVGCLAVLALIAACVFFDPSTERRERVDELSQGPWVVQKLANGLPVFLTFESRKNVLYHRWTADPADAWKYAESRSALMDAEGFDGVARPLKIVLAEGVL